MVTEGLMVVCRLGVAAETFHMTNGIGGETYTNTNTKTILL